MCHVNHPSQICKSFNQLSGSGLDCGGGIMTIVMRMVRRRKPASIVTLATLITVLLYCVRWAVVNILLARTVRLRPLETRVAQIKKVIVLMTYFVLSDH